VAVVIICMFRQYTCPILDSRSSDLITAKSLERRENRRSRRNAVEKHFQEGSAAHL
jgi:hypothetical protein